LFTNLARELQRLPLSSFRSVHALLRSISVSPVADPGFCEKTSIEESVTLKRQQPGLFKWEAEKQSPTQACRSVFLNRFIRFLKT